MGGDGWVGVIMCYVRFSGGGSAVACVCVGAGVWCLVLQCVVYGIIVQGCWCLLYVGL